MVRSLGKQFHGVTTLIAKKLLFSLIVLLYYFNYILRFNHPRVKLVCKLSVDQFCLRFRALHLIKAHKPHNFGVINVAVGWAGVLYAQSLVL